MNKQIRLLLASSALFFTPGCGSQAAMTPNLTPLPTSSELASAELAELPEAGAATPILASFSFPLTGRSALDSAAGALSDVAGFTPGAAQASRLVVSFVDYPAGLLDRRLNLEVGRNGGPLLASGLVYPIGSGSLRVVYLERSSPVRAEIFEGTAGSLRLLESAPGTGKGGRASFRLEGVRLVSRSGQTSEINGTATLEF